MNLENHISQNAITVYRLSKQSNVSTRTLHRVVRGEVEPRGETARQIAQGLEALGAPLHECKIRGCKCPATVDGGTP